MLAFFMALGNNQFTGMRLFCSLAFALWLCFPAVASQLQDPADSAGAAGDSPAQSTAPESSPAQFPPADSQPAATAPAENPQPAPPPAETATSPAQKTAESIEKKPTVARKKRRKRTPAPSDTPRKVVVREGGAREPAEEIVPGLSSAEAARQRQNAEQWLNTTDGQLKQLAERGVNPDQLETIGQIRNYMNGARGALREGDLRRASTLAEKAHLLSDDLVKH